MIELPKINAFFSLGAKIKELAEDCVIWLVENSENNNLKVKYSDNTNGDFSEINDFPNVNREGKYFTTDDHNSYWFLGLTVNDEIENSFSFSLSYKGNINLDSLKEDFDPVTVGEWTYFKLDKSFICKENSDLQKSSLRREVKTLLEKIEKINEGK